MDILLLQTDTPIKSQDRVIPNDSVGFRVPSPESAANLGEAFLRVACARADYPAVSTKAGLFTYDWIRRAAECVRRYLRKRPDYARGARVALQLSNSPEYLAAFYGTLLADCVVVPLPPSLEDLRRLKIYEICRPDVLITRAGDFDSKECHSPIETLQLLNTGEEELSFSPPHSRDHDLAMLLFTSGSTGLPKGVMLSHRNLLANAGSILRELPIRPDDKTLVVLPFCHAFGNSVLQTHILSGATLLLDRTSTFPSSIVEALKETGATSFSAVPEMYGMLLRYGRLEEQSLETLRYMTVAGGKLRHDLAAEIADRIAPASFFVMYGQSEATARLASLPPEQFHARRESIGRPIPGVELAVMDETDREAPPNVVGMLCARGENVMLGYWQDSTTTAAVLGQNGWLRTGDLAHRDADGFFYLHGRANLLVKVQGHRVHPAEIEGLVETSFPQTSAVAIPVARGDEFRFVLFLAPRTDEPIDVAKIRATCQRELPPYKVPLQFETIERFPLTSGHKIDREALARLVADSAKQRELTRSPSSRQPVETSNP
jgi:long-chain acyl-CoA synthetase